VHLAFKTRELRSLCEGSHDAQEKYGAVIANKLRLRLAQIYAAPTPLDLPPNTYTLLGEGIKQHMIFHLDQHHCLIVAPNLVDASTDANGIIDWNRVARVKITSLEVCDE
jgi:plasmid maintenance system killer protein